MAGPQLGESGPITSRLYLLYIPLHGHICVELLCQTVTWRGISDLTSDDGLRCSEGDRLVSFIWQAGGCFGMLVGKLISRDVFMARYIEQIYSCGGKGLKKSSGVSSVWVFTTECLKK